MQIASTAILSTLGLFKNRPSSADVACLRSPTPQIQSLLQDCWYGDAQDEREKVNPTFKCTALSSAIPKSDGKSWHRCFSSDIYLCLQNSSTKSGSKTQRGRKRYKWWWTGDRMVLMQFSLYFVVIVTNSSYHKLEFSLDNHPDQTQQLHSRLSAVGTEIQ